MDETQTVRGRPRLSLMGDRERFAVALADALVALGGKGDENLIGKIGRTPRSACLAVAKRLIGVEVSLKYSNGIVVDVTFSKLNAPGVAATFEGKAATLKQKRRDYTSPLDNFWRAQIASALMLTLADRARSKEILKADVLALAEAVGEAEFARSVLFEMIDARLHVEAS